MVLWRRNLIFCWFGAFVTGIGMSQIAPIMPLYIRQLGIENANLDVELTGLAFGITFVVSAVFSPIWGKAADKFGRKPMLLRASLGMAIVIAAMGFAPNAYVLISIRALQGMITGYTMACTTLIATQTDKEHAGWALGVLSTAGVSGSLLGPILGGIVAQYWGYQSVFFITGGLMMLSFMTTVIFITHPANKQAISSKTMIVSWDENCRWSPAFGYSPRGTAKDSRSNERRRLYAFGDTGSFRDGAFGYMRCMESLPGRRGSRAEDGPKGPPARGATASKHRPREEGAAEDHRSLT